jgi:hypothetical protein
MKRWLWLAIRALALLGSRLGQWKRALRWLEDHAGLGGWVGAVGAIFAVFAAYLISQSEWRAARHLEDERMNEEIALIDRTASDFERLVQEHMARYRAHGVVDAQGSVLLKKEDDPRWRRMVEFVNMPLTQSPSVESYDAVRTYFDPANQLLGLLDYPNADASAVDHWIKEREGKLEALKKALAAARRK